MLKSKICNVLLKIGHLVLGAATAIGYPVLGLIALCLAIPMIIAIFSAAAVVIFFVVIICVIVALGYVLCGYIASKKKKSGSEDID